MIDGLSKDLQCGCRGQYLLCGCRYHPQRGIMLEYQLWQSLGEIIDGIPYSGAFETRIVEKLFQIYEQGVIPCFSLKRRAVNRFLSRTVSSPFRGCRKEGKRRTMKLKERKRFDSFYTSYILHYFFQFFDHLRSDTPFFCSAFR